MTSTVLVTGGTGFVGVRCVLQLLEKSYNVKATMRSPKRKAALFSPTAKNIIPQLGRYRNASNDKAKNILGWQPRSNEEAILATAESLFRFGLIEKS